MLLFSGAPEDPEDDTVMEMHGADAVNSAVNSLMHAIRTEDPDVQQDAAHWMFQIVKPRTMRRWSESKLANGKPLVWIPKENAHLVDLEWTEDMQAKLKTLVVRYTSRGGSGAWRVHRWRLACISLGLADTEDRNQHSGQWYDQWPLDTWVDSPIFRWPRDTLLPQLVNAPGEYPNLMKTKHQMRHSCTNLKVINVPCLVLLLRTRRYYFVLCQAWFVIWSGGSQSVLRIIWIFSTCVRKWATMSAQKCSSNSTIHLIPLCL